MNIKQVLVLTGSLCLAGEVAAIGFFDDLKKAVQDTAEQTVIMVASDLVKDMIIDATTKQTTSEKEISREYEEENGSLPASMTVTGYQTLVFPGESINPGQKVRVKSFIEVVPGQDGKHAKIEETLTIWDNEDSSKELKSMTKEAGDSGGVYEGEFAFTLPEGMPQGVYPVSVSLMLDGEWVRDDKHQLQLVLFRLPNGERFAKLSK